MTRYYKIKAENYPFSLGDSVDRLKARLLEEWNSTGEYVPRILKVAPHKITLKNRDKIKTSRKRRVAPVTLTIILYYLITFDKEDNRNENLFNLFAIKSPGVDIDVRSSTTAQAFKSFIRKAPE
ncbi:MAG: hypothetical protein FJ240_11645 [Nitrospira sp.]|nr:hypothetical protein [Nitrospira sp.]